MLDVPKGLMIARAEKPRMVKVRIKIANMAILTAYDSIFLPRYSGVRPTISPAMNTARITKTTIPYRPAPTPPKTTSPSMMLIRGTMPPRGGKESCCPIGGGHADQKENRHGRPDRPAVTL